MLKVGKEIDLILKAEESTLSEFEDPWRVYSPAIIKYANSSRSKSKELEHALRSSTDYSMVKYFSCQNLVT